MKNTRSSEPYQFSNIRSQNKNEILEDYVEAIQEILQNKGDVKNADLAQHFGCLLYTSPSPRDSFRSRMPSSA